MLEPGFPQQISVESARKWPHETGFEVFMARKGVFVDGYEHSDVIESQTKFLRKMVKLVFYKCTNRTSWASYSRGY